MKKIIIKLAFIIFIFIALTPFKTSAFSTTPEELSSKLNLNQEDKMYTVEDILYNRVPVFDVNIFEESEKIKELDRDAPLIRFREIVKNWYVVFYTLANSVMVLMLVYTGIRLLFNTVGSEKARKKDLLVGWVKGFVLLNFAHMIMYSIVTINDQFVSAFSKVNESMSEDMGNLYNVILSRALDFRFTIGVAGTILYVLMVVLFVNYIMVYLLRFMRVMVLTLAVPVVIVKNVYESAGKKVGKSFQTWLQDYLTNVSIQMMQALIYTILMKMVLSMGFVSIMGLVMAIIVLNNILSLTRTVMKMFRFSSTTSKLGMESLSENDGKIVPGKLAKSAVKMGVLGYGAVKVMKFQTKGLAKLTEKVRKKIGKRYDESELKDNVDNLLNKKDKLLGEVLKTLNDDKVKKAKLFDKYDKIKKSIKDREEQEKENKKQEEEIKKLEKALEENIKQILASNKKNKVKNRKIRKRIETFNRQKAVLEKKIKRVPYNEFIDNVVLIRRSLRNNELGFNTKEKRRLKKEINKKLTERFTSKVKLVGHVAAGTTIAAIGIPLGVMVDLGQFDLNPKSGGLAITTIGTLTALAKNSKAVSKYIKKFETASDSYEEVKKKYYKNANKSLEKSINIIKFAKEFGIEIDQYEKAAIKQEIKEKVKELDSVADIANKFSKYVSKNEIELESASDIFYAAKEFLDDIDDISDVKKAEIISSLEVAGKQIAIEKKIEKRNNLTKDELKKKREERRKKANRFVLGQISDAYVDENIDDEKTREQMKKINRFGYKKSDYSDKDEDGKFNLNKFIDNL